MDTLKTHRQLIRKILTDYAKIPYAHGNIQIETVFGSESDRYLLMIVGRDNRRRIHGCLVHIDIINGKIWIQRDGTEYGIANELVDVGVPKNRIVLGFRSPKRRKHTEFAVG
ncbi:XisI protein [Candidatus Poribacteria bacterium]|nr:XisI protein [Candidatus Poribacteria bacterium]